MKVPLKSTEDIGYLLESGLFSDVTFIVGRERAVIWGHKDILIAGSRVFQALLSNKSPQELKKVNLSDVTPSEFRLLLKYLYTGAIGQFVERLPLLRVAKRFAVPLPGHVIGLEDIISGISVVNAPLLYEQAKEYDNEQLLRATEKFILKNAQKVFQTEEFLKLSPESFANLLSKDALAVEDEMEVLKALFKWGESELVRRKMYDTPGNLRTMIKQPFVQARLPRIDKDAFARGLEGLSIGEQDKMHATFAAFLIPEERWGDPVAFRPFNTNPRNYACSAFERYPPNLLGSDFVISKNTHESTFKIKSSRIIFLKSIGLFLYNSSDWTAVKTFLGSSADSYDFYFGNPLMEKYQSGSSGSQFAISLKIQEEGGGKLQGSIEKTLQGSSNVQRIPFEVNGPRGVGIRLNPRKNYVVTYKCLGPETIGFPQPNPGTIYVNKEMDVSLIISDAEVGEIPSIAEFIFDV